MERGWRDEAGVEVQGQEQGQTGTPDNELELIRTDRNPHWSLQKFRLNDGTLGNSLAVQWLGLQFTAGGMGSIPSQGTEISHAPRNSQNKLINKKQLLL